MHKLGLPLLLTLGLLLTPLWVGTAMAELKVGVVDGNDIIWKSAAGKRAQENLKKKYEELGRPLQQRQQDFAKMVAEAEKQASVMKEDARKRKEEELSKKMEEIKKQGMDAEKQFVQFREKEQGPLLQKLEQAVTAVAKDEKLDVVFDKGSSGLLYIDPKLDLTEKVRGKFGP
jgi:outer membrane protein